MTCLQRIATQGAIALLVWLVPHADPALPAAGRPASAGPNVLAAEPDLPLEEAVFSGVFRPNRICDLESGSAECRVLDSSESSYVEEADLDQDGHLDVLLENEICWGDGSGHFSCIDSPLTGEYGTIALLNADSNPDLFSEELICLNAGSRSFSCSAQASVEASDVRGVAAGLVDDDLSTDLVFGTTDDGVHQLVVCPGDGSGAFSTCSSIATSHVFLNIQIGDFNGDGFGDMVVSTAAGVERCLGSKAGTFSCSVIAQGSISDTLLADLDGDAELDLAFSSRPGRGGVCLGDGSGSFGCAPLFVGNHPASGISSGLLDADEFVDLMVSVWDFGRPNQVCIGDGTGQFTCSDFRWPGDHEDVTPDVVVGDFRTRLAFFEDSFETGDLSRWD